MQKVVYSISKVNKDEKLKGVGYLVEGNLLIPSTSQKGNAYIRVFKLNKDGAPLEKLATIIWFCSFGYDELTILKILQQEADL